ncbi:MAG: enoyl-CoA hydratase/isomerase family protein [Acidimicrobiia bacterium]|nr:enoyl-CoA hydratase/isomerase family protein [Acidimicrobiia bacterium]
MSSPPLLADRQGRVLSLVLNRPEAANAFNVSLITHLEAALAEATADPEVAVVVMGSALDSVFSAGMDAKESIVTDDTFLGLLRLQWSLEAFPKPLVAALVGHVIGGGAEVALSADIRIGREDTRFVFPATSYGLVQGTWHLVDIVAASWAREIVLTGRPVLAEEALRLGLLHEIHQDPLARAGEVAAAVSERSPRALIEVKRLFLAAAGRSMEERFRQENEVNERMRNDPDTRQRFQARFGAGGKPAASPGSTDDAIQKDET